MKRTILLFLLCVLCATPLAWSAQGKGEIQAFAVTTMTRNMFPGADLDPIVAVGLGQLTMQEAMAMISGQVTASDIPARAGLIAKEIAENKPDLVALQEATKWEITVEGNTIVLDQLELLMRALKKAGQHYQLAVVQKMTDVQLPGSISYTDNNAILVRANGPLNVVGSETHIYNYLMPLPFTIGGATEVLRGWMAVDIKFKGLRFKFVNTHLEAPLEKELDGPTHYLQFLQAQQLVAELSTVNQPIILAGDFNSDAEPTHNYSPDVTLSYGYVTGNGYQIGRAHV
jgi:endonuclease/exonuclease/phosphatase family metal-dependent hydrolase